MLDVLHAPSLALDVGVVFHEVQERFGPFEDIVGVPVEHLEEALVLWNQAKQISNHRLQSLPSGAPLLVYVLGEPSCSQGTRARQSADDRTTRHCPQLR